LFHGHFAEDRFFLGQITHAKPGALVHRVLCHIGVAKNDATAVWPDQANDHVKTRSLSRSVWPQKSYDLSSADVQVNSVNHRSAAINLNQLIRIEDALRLRRERRRSFWNRNGRGLADHGVGSGAAGTD
jgi:hypothetical protein